LENFDDVKLTDEEAAEWLRKGREAKHYKMKLQEYTDGLNNPKVLRNFRAEEYYKCFTDVFPINERKEKVYSDIVKRLCCYFSKDRRFEIKDFKLNKGILLFGGVGVGKTTLMQMFRQNQAFSYRLISCREIESEFAVRGPEVIEQFSVNQQVAVNANTFGHQEIGFCFDDLGTENAITKHFGNTKNVMTDILLNRYDRIKQNTPEGETPDFRGTHITTNLSVDEIEKLYGTRLLDRLREMMNLITFPETAESRR
jgi:hypothetical protein